MSEKVTKRLERPTHSRLVLLMATGFSVLVHTAVGFSMYNLPLARIDPKLLKTRRVFQVRRSAIDHIIEDRPVSPSATPHSRSEPSLTKLSELLLTEEASMPDKWTPKPAPPWEAHKLVDDERPTTDGNLIAKVPSFHLPTAVLQELAGRPRFEIVIFRGAEPDDHHARGEGAGHGRDGVPRAGDLLAQVGLRRWSNPVPQALGHPQLSERGPMPERRLIEKPPQVPRIDFAGIALGGTKRFNIPEQLDPDFDYQLSVYQAPEQRGTNSGYFRVDVTGRRSLRRLRTMPKDVVFVIDTSSSIPQHWVNATVAGVRDGLGSLNAGDRFNIVLFNERPAFFHPDQIQPFNAQTLAEARSFLDGARSAGFTDVNNALSRLLVRDVGSERVYYLVVITDGHPTRGLKDTRELIKLITRDNDLSASIYCLGIGSRSNRELLEFLAFHNRGFCVFLDERQETARAIRDLLGRLRFPILKEITLRVAGLDREDVYPRDLPNLHQGETFSIYGRFDHAGEFTMRLVGHNGKQMYDFTSTRNLKLALRGDKQTARQWARWKMLYLYSERIHQGETPQIREQIDHLRKRYGLRSRY